MNPSAVHIASRVLAGLVAGYAFCWGLVTLGIVLLMLRGMPYAEAQTLLYLLAFLVFLVVFLWSFASASLVRVWAILAGGGAAMTCIAWLLARSLA